MIKRGVLEVLINLENSSKTLRKTVLGDFLEIFCLLF